MMETNCTHIAPGDAHFTARMRLHQSWYRSNVLGIPPGKNPHADGRIDGNILGHESDEGGSNFLNREIREYAFRRRRENPGKIEPDRLRFNLLSSQPMCFNLFAPLHCRKEFAARLIGDLPGAPKDIREASVIVEYAPTKKWHLGDETSFDAFVEYRRSDGREGFIGIETKLTEPFSGKEYKFKKYSLWQSAWGRWWIGGTEKDFENIRFNQLWRNHLLAWSMIKGHGSEDLHLYDEGFCAVVHHEQDEDCTEAIAEYAKHLSPVGRETFLDWPLSTLIGTWRGLVEDPNDRKWIEDFSLRYLELEKSEEEWRKHPEHAKYTGRTKEG